MKHSIFQSILLMIVLVVSAAIHTGCDSLEVKMKRWGEQDNVVMLEKMLSHKRMNVRVHAISLIAYTSHSDALNPLLKCLQDNNAEIRMYAAQGLGYLGSCGVVDKPTVTQLANILKNPDYVSRHDVIAALGHSGLPDAIPPLEEMLHDKDVVIRKSAVDALECLARERKYPCSQIGPIEYSAITNLLETVAVP